jgi:hypothetical protein
MSEEKKVENVFRTYKKQFIKKLGRKALYNTTIDRVGAELFGTKWIGCFPQDKVVLRNGFQVLNVDKSTQSGSHWIGLYKTNNNIYIYDSFARPSGQLLKSLTKKIKGYHLKYKDSDRSDAEQRGDSEVCGQLSLSWLLCVKDLGIRKAMLI